MKKSFTLLGLAVLALGSCNNDDNDDTVSIVGKWKESEYKAYSGKDGSVISSYTEKPDDCDKKGFIELLSDGKMNYEFYYEKSVGVCDLDVKGSGTYVYDAAAKKLTYNWSASNQDFELVKTLTSNRLEVVVDDHDFNNDGIKDIETIVYTK